jgi:uncharacterized protein (TIGR00299 family) protein
MTTAYFDCFSGAAGDMIVGSLLDAGASIDAIRETLSKLNVSGYSVKAEKMTKQGFASTRFIVDVGSGDPDHRHLKDILAILDEADLPDPVKTQSRAVFSKLGAAEAEVHGSTIEKIHFHEVGAVDAIVDVVAAASALHQLGIDRVVCSPICVGSGTVRMAHGELPVPAPATAILLRGVPIIASNEPGERTTPTGAAILTTLADYFGALPNMTTRAIGYGAGAREGLHRPNLLRVMLGTVVAEAERDEVVVLETAIDDCTGEALGHTMERLLNAGALDAYCLPIQMKKSRPGSLLTAICSFADADRLEAIIFAETTTFGIRRSTARRSKLSREHQTVETPFGAVRIKIGRRGDQVVSASPEFEDCRRIAIEKGVPLRTVEDAARAAWLAGQA